MVPRLSLAAIGAALLLLGGCASYEKGDAAQTTADLAAPKAPAEVEAPGDHDRNHDGGTADPYRERAGNHGAGKQEVEAEPGSIAFKEPKRWPKVLDERKRPTLPGKAKLAVALVRSGDLAFEAKVVLALEELLADDPGLKTITALAAPKGREVTLAQLAEQARKAGRALLLVDLRPGRNGEPREGLLVWTKTGGLLASYPIAKDARPPPAPTDGSPLDVCDRLRLAYARLRR